MTKLMNWDTKTKKVWRDMEVGGSPWRLVWYLKSEVARQPVTTIPTVIRMIRFE